LDHWRRNRAFALFASFSVALLGGVASAGWLFHNEALKSIIPGAAPIKPNMAVGMLLCGGALALLSRRKVAMPIRIGAMAMAWDDRIVRANDVAVGVTNHMIVLPPNDYEITLAGDGFAPPTQDIELYGTSLARPCVLVFT